MEIIFVYNAKSDRLSSLFDFAHKIVSPSTYACDLCKLTHTTFGERDAWKTFTRTSKIPLIFYHIDEFEKVYKQSFTYPIVLKKVEKKLNIILNSLEISKLTSTDELMGAINHHL